jgi:hypothetical protein
MAGQSAWTITGQMTGQVINTQSGRTLVGVEVFFVTADGNEGSVFIPDNLYTAKHVHEAVHVQANKLDEVGRLAEGMIG